jgi:hypothetical protein
MTLTPALSRRTGRGSTSADALDAPLNADSGFAIGCGAVTLVLESRDALEQRGRKPLATILACSGGTLRGNHAVGDASHVVREMESPRNVITSANGSWIDRVEAAALAHVAPGTTVSSLYGYFPETFSVDPLAGIAATLLGRTLPALHGNIRNLPHGLAAATGAERIDDSVGVLCTGLNGTVAGARIVLPQPDRSRS